MRRVRCRWFCRLWILGMVAGCQTPSTGGDETATSSTSNSLPTASDTNPNGSSVSSSTSNTTPTDASSLPLDESSDDTVSEEEDCAPLSDEPKFDIGFPDIPLDPDCVPAGDSELHCDGVDDDCNGLVDDVDIGGDGICDCLKLLILGNPGPNPAADFTGWLQTRGLAVTRVPLTDATVVDARLLQSHHVLIFDGLARDFSTAEVDAIWSWVQDRGGGLISLSGHEPTGIFRDRANAALSRFGVTYVSVAVQDGPAQLDEGITFNSGVRSVPFFGGYPVASESCRIYPFGWIPNDIVVGRATRVGQGRLLVFGDEWLTFDNEWSSMPEIPKLWANWLHWVHARDVCDVPL